MLYEKELIGSALQDPSILDPERIPADFFTDKRNRAIWTAMLSLRQAGAPVDLLTIAESLNGHAESIGASYLASCSDNGSAANAAFYIGKVSETARLRAFDRILMQAKDQREQGKDSDELITGLEAGLLEVRRSADTTATIRPAHALREILDIVEARMKSGDTGPTGVPSGFSELDAMTGGFQPGDLVLIAARTSIGKSALAISFIEKQIAKGRKVALASLEMSAVQVWQRLLAMRSFVSTGKLRFNHLDSDDYRALVSAANELRKSGLAIIDKPVLTANGLRSWAAQMVAEGCSIIYVDYVGLLHGSDNGAPRWEQMSEVSRGLKAIAREFKIPVVGLVQLNREAADVREPGLHNMRDTGALEQDCDVALILTRSEGESAEDSVPASLFLKKQRSGPTGKIPLMFRKSLTQFREATE